MVLFLILGLFFPPRMKFLEVVAVLLLSELLMDDFNILSMINSNSLIETVLHRIKFNNK